ncbi:hypothetical protein MNV49_005015 [Pseudohyphozyma bogoriensis]|nr:hypothetical protein MNV49_005015 [Pseudohyphozyma bogoriensis]
MPIDQLPIELIGDILALATSNAPPSTTLSLCLVHSTWHSLLEFSLYESITQLPPTKSLALAMALTKNPDKAARVRELELVESSCASAVLRKCKGVKRLVLRECDVSLKSLLECQALEHLTLHKIDLHHVPTPFIHLPSSFPHLKTLHLKTFTLSPALTTPFLTPIVSSPSLKTVHINFVSWHSSPLTSTPLLPLIPQLTNLTYLHRDAPSTAFLSDLLAATPTSPLTLQTLELTIGLGGALTVFRSIRSLASLYTLILTLPVPSTWDIVDIVMSEIVQAVKEKTRKPGERWFEGLGRVKLRFLIWVADPLVGRRTRESLRASRRTLETLGVGVDLECEVMTPFRPRNEPERQRVMATLEERRSQIARVMAIVQEPEDVTGGGQAVGAGDGGEGADDEWETEEEDNSDADSASSWVW